MEEVAGLKEAFDMMDSQKRGKINLGEFKVGLQKLGHQIPDTDVQILMEAVRNIFITFPPFLLYDCFNGILAKFFSFCSYFGIYCDKDNIQHFFSMSWINTEQYSVKDLE